ncbi:MAG: histidinol-phosphate aminotransferase family protein [Candidatus Thiodiazotropha sp. (ex Lucinoma aequizonata)]|nr:histidinol-phosphate aminotransferase family protein [Candidatus Thiodiazotropha sp. (ex Lucinoma aequizonata)]MCU7889677.1 histidinol-phosphate aminotransferase family protein [Candidatus Thiodiazotropha sp. (ex Lucinoma aequizonata)]MCU7895912.1 histidinol-phosphate aminotransferase family protein [Candidatus Thiodiazotropha sp. (ex Lucinoma aequizonata)]MCU7898517.1 histidinol-phosphate aminotransferase family protein [Candidatus Thiodiazotropha sp. (ex Lucinoma aequizonata)]MCU7900710.1 
MHNQDQSSREQQYEALATAHGGYWRYGFIDHAYLYNLHFPPERFFDLLKNQIHELVLNYPVAQSTLAGWVGDLIDQPPERLVVGNGAAELIKILSGHIAKKLIVPVPSFNEYANAAPAGAVVEFALGAPSFQLDVDKFAVEARRCKADIAVVVTPNNPTSLLVPKADIIRLVRKLAEHDCMLIVDESFIDFASNRDQETLERDIELHPNLAIFKSMSKAYGICGLRIGYMLTANAAFADKVRAGLHIWNLNGFAETFLKMVPEYRKEFKSSCAQVRKDRDRFYQDLCTIEGMVVYKPDANYIFCRLPDHPLSGPEVAQRLFVEHNIYIKHCEGKSMPDSGRYVRMASRTPAENANIVAALNNLLAPENNAVSVKKTGSEKISCQQ